MMSKTGMLLAATTMFLTAGSTVRAGDLFDGIFDDRRTIRGSGTMVSENREVASFTRIEVAMGIDIVVTVGSPQQVTLTFDDNIIGKVKTRVRGNTLEIDSRGSFSTSSECKIEITVPSIEEFSLAGSGNIEIRGIAGEKFEIDLAGSGNIRIDGRTKNLEIDVAGSGDIDARDLIAEEAEVSIAGSGNVRVYAEKSLEAEISGSGDIRYYGDPDVESDVSGSGSIKRGRG